MFSFFLSPLGRKIGFAILAVILLASLVAFIYQRGKSAGYADGQRTQLELDKAQFQAERKQFLETLSHYQEQDDAAKQKIAQKDSELAQLQSRRLAAKRNVALLPASEVIPDIRRNLGTSGEGVLSESELRRIDEAITSAVGLADEVSLLQAKSQAQDERIAAIEKQRDAAVLYGNQVTGYYVRAYAAAQKKPSLFLRIVTFGLYHGKTLSLPAPASLHP